MLVRTDVDRVLSLIAEGADVDVNDEVRRVATNVVRFCQRYSIIDRTDIRTGTRPNRACIDE